VRASGSSTTVDGPRDSRKALQSWTAGAGLRVEIFVRPEGYSSAV